jgi:arthrofactin-type cyclic lipopeptide synthetase B
VAREEEGEKRLVAYYTGQEVGAEELRKWLSTSLPEYMVPAAYVHLESLPLTANGKLDRRGLPAPEGEAYVRRGYEPPVGEIETQLAHILTDLLRLERVGRYDNFFELGGDSLSAMRFVVRCRQMSIAISVTDVFTYPTIESLVASVQEQCTGNQ